eukprot:gnl/Ergobibamus_cyprinoides/3617.p2 GENE.gnl/Ergobibamus_cyprinoides/3617~~gnl/Ergobibamus_cyprinoides/3617.p2  ORF type:complete len:281 (+),score=85.78 gnl/Ergobibamus_cyprinoides/3617:610-1452(+)
MRKMLQDKNLVRHLEACEVMGGATNICSDKTGTLTENRMTVVQAWLGGQFFQKIPSDTSTIHDAILDLVNVGCAVNSSAFITASAAGLPQMVGSKTECALLMLTKRFGSAYRAVRDAASIAHIFTFSSARKRMSTVVDLSKSSLAPLVAAPALHSPPPADDVLSPLRLYCKGASEIVLGLCTHYVDGDGQVRPLSEELRADVMAKIERMATKGLRTLALSYRNIPAATGRPPHGVKKLVPDGVGNRPCLRRHRRHQGPFLSFPRCPTPSAPARPPASPSA